MKRYLVLVVLVFLSVSKGQAQTQCSEFNTPEKARIYYVNGMLSDMVDNHNARNTLASVVGNPENNVYRTSMNRTKGWGADGWQALRQRSNEVDPVEFWQQWHGTNPGFPQTSQEFKEALSDAIVAAATAQVNTDADLAAMVQQYLIDLGAGKKVVLVAHSQGNFYANRAQEFITANNPQLAQSLGVISVASPSGTLAPNGLLTQNDKDSIIFGIVSPRYTVLPANVSFFGNDANKRNHGFLTTYMLPNNARNRIRDHVVAMINNLPEPINEECDSRVAEITTLSAIDVESTEATLRGNLTQGQGVDAWISFDLNASNVVCNSSGQSGPNSFNAPSTVSQTATNLVPNKLYYYRACAEGEVGGISDGGLRQFVTKRNSGKVSTPVADATGRFSFRLKTDVLEGSNIDVWFVRGSVGGSAPSCLGSGFDGVGMANAGDTIFSGTFSNLAAGATYGVRACAKGSDGVTNSSPVNFVTTTAIPTATCGFQAFQGGTDGLSVIFSLGSSPGFAAVEFQTFSIPDKLEIFKHNTNQLLLSTNGFISGQFNSSFQAGGVEKVDVYVTGNSQTNTQWELVIRCPE